MEEQAAIELNESLKGVYAAADLKGEEVPDEAVVQSIRRTHANLGHPSKETFLRILRHGHASDKALKVARDFSCEICDAKKNPGSFRDASAKEKVPFPLEAIQLDCKEYPSWQTGKKVNMFNVIDEGSHYFQAARIKSHETSRDILRVYREGWLRWLSAPDRA